MSRAEAGARTRSVPVGARTTVRTGSPAGVHHGIPASGSTNEAVMPVGLIEGYRVIENVAGEMLRAGRAGDWPRVRDLGVTIRDLGDDITRAGGPAALTPEQRRERMRILKRLILLDGELRHLSDPVAGWIDTMFARPATPEAHRSADAG